MDIKNRDYTATPAEISALTRDMIRATGTIGQRRGEYLRALVATTQAKLGTVPKNARHGPTPKLKDAERAAQLSALMGVHEVFYGAVTVAAREGLPAGSERALELNRRTNFARTALYSVRSYIKAGRDITAIAAARLTKVQLDVPRVVRPPTEKRLLARVEARSGAMVKALIELSEKNKAAALSAIETLMGRFATVAGAQPTRDLDVAVAEHRPFMAKGKQLFVPTATGIFKAMPAQGRA